MASYGGGSFGAGAGVRGLNTGRPGGAGNLNFQRGPGFRVFRNLPSAQRSGGGAGAFINRARQQGQGFRTGPVLKPTGSDGVNRGPFSPWETRTLQRLRGAAIDPGAGDPNIRGGPYTGGTPRTGPAVTPPNSPVARTGSLRINLGGGQRFRQLANQIAQNQRVANSQRSSGVIQLGGRGIQPMRHPGALATEAGRRAANAGLTVFPVLTPAQRRAANANPRAGGGASLPRQNPINRARRMGQGF